MKINPNYIGRLFTEQELSIEERKEAKRIPSMKKERGQLSDVVVRYKTHGIYLSELFIVENA